MNNYDTVIGIEIHCELKTKTKCFSPAPNTFGKVPNSQTNPIDCGYPGTLPTVNQAVVIAAIKTCSALKMEIDHLLRFDRKNYFYPDLPKGYQITQFYHPIGRNGHLSVHVDDKPFTITFERLHIEEDTAKQIHEGKQTLLDYNRAGIPLLEIVTKPIFTNSKQVIAYITALRQILICLNISDAKMNEGSLRCDINISLKPSGSKILGTKVEIKNLNSLNNITLAINDEIIRQTTILNNKKEVMLETRRFDEQTNKTILMRSKNEETDYKYFPEPNIFPIQLEQNWVNNIIDSMPELPEVILNKLTKHYKLTLLESNFLLERPDLLNLFEATVNLNHLPIPTYHYCLGQLQAYLNANNITLNNTKLTALNLSQLITLIVEQKVNDKQSKQILEIIMKNDEQSPNSLIESLNLTLVSNKQELQTILEQLLQDNGKMLLQYQTHPERVTKFFMGQLMKITKGQANPQIAQEILTILIKNHQTTS